MEKVVRHNFLFQRDGTKLKNQFYEERNQKKKEFTEKANLLFWKQ